MNEYLDLLKVLGLLAIFPGSLIAGFVGMIWWTVKSGEKEWKQREKEDNEWLAAEMAKPKTEVVFTLVTGEVLSTGVLEPYCDMPGSDWNFRETSAGLALRHMNASHERGYFRDENGVTYPACNIKEARLKVK